MTWGEGSAAIVVDVVISCCPSREREVRCAYSGEWTVQQARNLALSLGERLEGIKFLVRDRGPNFTAWFDAVFQAAGTRILRTAVQAPRMNAICERLVGTLRRELLDRVLILGERHLRAVLAEYQAHYNTARPHQGIAQHVPDGEPDSPPRHGDRRRHTTDSPETCPGRPDQRIHARRLTTEDLQVIGKIVFPGGTGPHLMARTWIQQPIAPPWHPVPGRRHRRDAGYRSKAAVKVGKEDARPSSGRPSSCSAVPSRE